MKLALLRDAMRIVTARLARPPASASPWRWWTRKPSATASTAVVDDPAREEAAERAVLGGFHPIGVVARAAVPRVAHGPRMVSSAAGGGVGERGVGGGARRLGRTV